MEAWTMERVLEVTCGGAASRFTARKLSRASLYGSKRRVPVDVEGRPCQTAALTRDGRFLLPKGSTATLYLDPEGDMVERAELRSAGKSQVEEQDAQPASAEAADVLDCTARQVYGLTPVAISESLEALLAPTGICRLPNKPGSPGTTRFLVKNDTGYFLLVGEPSGFEFAGPDQADLSIPDAGEGWDELDFAML
jgi:hypothetical protein